MPIEILMPALSPTMTEGTLANWLKKEGDSISSGDVIAEIETDKATMEVEAVDEGTLGKILIAAGVEDVPVNAVIALLLEEGEDASALDGYEVSQPAPAKEEPKEEVKSDAAPATAPAAPVPLGAPQALPVASATVAAPTPVSSTGGRVVASPLAKRIAAESGIDLSRVIGSGPRGRIIRADVEEAVASGGSGGVVRRTAPEAVTVPLNNMRKVIARRLLEAKQTIPHFYLTIECGIDRLLAVRSEANAIAADAVKGTEQKPAYKISVNDMVIKAVALALRDVPEANSNWGGDHIVQFNNVDVSVAVAIDGGLITPIVRNADQKNLVTVSNEMKALAAKARAGKLQPEEYQGGGFSISNLGMYGIKQFNAIISPPQSCILAVGAGEEKLVMENGQPKVINVMQVTLSSDHRVVDGAVGAVFLQAFKKYIEAPVGMLL